MKFTKIRGKMQEKKSKRVIITPVVSVRTCPECGGSGYDWDGGQCPRCGGLGEVD